MSKPHTRILRALRLAVQHGGHDGAHHKDWVIDQMVRALCGSEDGEATEAYNELVGKARDGEDGPETYSWNVGIAP